MSGKYLKIQKSVLLSWIASYALILFIPLIINSVIYLQSSKIIEKQITDSNTSMLKQFQKEIDGHLEEIENLSLRISVNPRLISLMNVKDENEILNSYSIIKQVRDMNEDFTVYALSSRFIDSVYIYFNNKDLVWCNNSNIYDKKTFYDNFIFNEEINYHKWTDMMNKRHVSINSPFYVKGENGESTKTIAHFQSLPISLTDTLANFVVILDETKFNDYIENISKINNSFVYILDKNDNVLFSSQDKTNLVPDMKYNDMNENIGLIDRKIDGQDVVVSYISSKASEWKYVCVIPNSVFIEKVVYVRNLTIICFLLCIILGGIAIAILAKKNYNPLNELVNTLRNRSQINKNKDFNEFGFIKNSIIDVYNENEFINRKLELQNNALRLNFISRLLKGRFGGNAPDIETLSSYGISFNSEAVIILVFYIEPSSDINFNSIDNKEDGYGRIFENIILGELKTLLGDEFNVYYSEVDEMSACILDVNSNSEELWRESINNAINKLQTITKEKIKFNFTVAISGLNRTIQGINLGYQEAMEAMEYRLFNTTNNIIYYDDIKLLEQRSYNYYYTIEDEQKLINSIKTGNFNNAQEIVESVIRQNFSTRSISISMAKCVVFDLISTFIKALNNEGALNEISFLEDNNFMGKVLSRKTLDEMKEELLKCLKSICDYMYEYSEDKSKNKIVDKVRTLIEENYSDVNLNVSTLADQIDMNSKYIATLYKEATGESILDLINKIRINNAKILLKEDMNIAETAERVGFSNSNALIRAFKKCEGITPGQFKELFKTLN